MINSLHIRNFKVHEELELNMGALTLFTGVNGMGKSSVIQSLLLVRQSYLSRDISSVLNLKGTLVELGASGDLACQSSKESFFSLDIKGGMENVQLKFDYPEQVQDTILFAHEDNTPVEKLGEYSLFTKDFQYIGAFRFGPQTTYERDSYQVQVLKQISKKMGQCEYVVHYLSVYSKSTIGVKELAIASDEEKMMDGIFQLDEQVQRWLRYISPNVNISIESFDDFFKLGYKYDRSGNLKTAPISATNTGYGVTYCLPIIVAVLSAQPGSLIIVENPEAHIHPRGQAKLMELLSLAARFGIQIVIETHSDHIVNGALLSIHKQNLKKEQVAIYFFERDESRHTSIAHNLEIMESGRIKRPPKGFFDQIEIDLRTLVGTR